MRVIPKVMHNIFYFEHILLHNLH